MSCRYAATVLSKWDTFLWGRRNGSGIQMASKVQVVLIDDLDGGDADRTVSFALEGMGYEIDLSTANAAKLRDALAPYIEAGRRASGKRATRRGRASAGSRSAEIRAWAAANGIAVNPRGRVPADVVAKFEAAH